MILRKAIRKRRLEAEKARKKANAIKLAKVAVTGITVGAIGGVLLAPKSGKETRKDIADGVTETGQAISNKSKEIAAKTNDSLQNTKDKFSESKEKIKDYFDKKKNEVDVSIEECFDDITKNAPSIPDADEVKDAVDEKVDEVSDNVSDKVDEVVENAYNKADDVKENVKDAADSLNIEEK